MVREVARADAHTANRTVEHAVEADDIEQVWADRRQVDVMSQEERSQLHWGRVLRPTVEPQEGMTGFVNNVVARHQHKRSEGVFAHGEHSVVCCCVLYCLLYLCCVLYVVCCISVVNVFCDFDSAVALHPYGHFFSFSKSRSRICCVLQTCLAQKKHFLWPSLAVSTGCGLLIFWSD
jgi:hypothetical protein